MSETLRGWIREQGLTVQQFAHRLGKPAKTVEDWVYRGKNPSRENRALVFSLTGLAEFQPSGEESRVPKVRLPTTFSYGEMGTRQVAELLVEDLKGHIRLAEKILQVFTDVSLDLRDMLRAQLDPREVAYFSALLRAILSEERLREFEIATKISNSMRRGQEGEKYAGKRESSDRR